MSKLMMPELVSLIEKPWLLFCLLAVGVVCGMLLERLLEGVNKAERRAYWRGREGGRKVSGAKISQFRKQTAVQDDRSDIAVAHLRHVMRAEFKARPLLNKPERRLLAVLDRVLLEETPGWRAMGQVSLGEILSSEDKDAYFAINSKRVDLLLIDRDCRPLCAIEFQGTGHHLGEETAARDATKKEALRRAGIKHREVFPGNTPAEVREMVRKLVQDVTGHIDA